MPCEQKPSPRMPRPTPRTRRPIQRQPRPSAGQPRPRVERLAARVRWLDRYRRVVALSAAAVVAPYLIAEVAAVLGAEWPEMHATLLSLMLGVIVWWIIEVGLVYLTALWETEQERLIRDRGLPRAIVIRAR